MRKAIGIAVSALLLGACAAPAAPPASSMGSAPSSPAHKVGLANPASVFCIQQGGKLRMEKTQQGEHAMCILANGQAIEEWAYFRQHHPQKP